MSQIPARAVRLRLHHGQPGGGVLGEYGRQRRDLQPMLGVRGPGRLLTFGEGVEGWFRQPADLPPESGHLRQHTAGGGPVARVLGQAACDQPPQFGGQGAQTSRAVDQPVDQGNARSGTEGSLTRGREGDDRSQAENVTRRPDDMAEGMLGRHEPG
jgi:hypothetical protein